jgi:hypothetical protein
MNLKLQAIQIDPANPFANDLLNRQGEIENLSILIQNVNSPAVIAIDSRWGTGKTTFIKMWEQQLKHEGFDPLYFNAWATDFSEDPLVSFLGEMNDGLEALIGKSDESRQAWSKAKAVGKQIAKRSVPALIKIATAGVIDAEKIIEDELSKAMESLAGDALDDYLKAKNAITAFHEALTQLIEISSKDKPVVIFVDELDRCRPTYAISLLERIKHLFNIEGLVFVLALDKKQLGHSISAVYGDGIDSDGYLRRFIDFEYQLKCPERKNYINSLFSALSLNEYFEVRKKYQELQYDRGYLENVFIMLAECQNLSLREIEQLLASINLALRTAKENEYIHPALLVFLVVTKNTHPEQYQNFVSESGSEKETIEYLYRIVPRKKRLGDFEFECALVEGFLIAAKYSRHQQEVSDDLERHKAIIASEESSREEKSYSEIVINVATRPVGMGRGVALNTLVERIDLISQFKFSEEG